MHSYSSSPAGNGRISEFPGKIVYCSVKIVTVGTTHKERTCEKAF